MNPHIGGGHEPCLELNVRIFICLAGRTRAALKCDTVGGGDRIEELILELRRADRGEVGVDHILGEGLFPQAGIGTAVLNIDIKIWGSANLQIDLVEIVARGQLQIAGGVDRQALGVVAVGVLVAEKVNLRLIRACAFFSLVSSA